MKKNLFLFATIFFALIRISGQTQTTVGTWKTWFIGPGKSWRLPKPASFKNEIAEVLTKQQRLDDAGCDKILYWNAGAPGYHWQKIMAGLWMMDTSSKGPLANMLLGVATYDATVAAWDTKYAYNRPHPFTADERIKSYLIKPASPSYPCEYSVAAGVAATLIGYFYPSMADSMKKLALEVMDSRVAAGVAFPSDTRDGFAMGKKLAEKEIELTKGFIPGITWDGRIPSQPGLWNGKRPMFPLAGRNKTMVLDSGNQFRPVAPPDFAKEMEELKKFKPGFQSQANAFFFASQSFWDELLDKKIFEHNLHLDPPLAARLYAITAIGMYDGFIACWDAKYAYWGIRPDQYDTSFHPSLIHTPPFPGYPSGHAAISAVMAGLYTYFFPADEAYFHQRAKDAAESRFQGGIHFRTDNEVGLELGKKVAAAIIQKVKMDEAGKNLRRTY